jgi:outer membrane protein assembly factor BamA
MKGAYAVTLKRWEYDFRINHKLGGKIGPYFDFGMYQQAMTSDEWMFNELENTIAGLFFKEDFHDFYWERGFTGEAGVFVGQDLTARMEYTAARITNLEKTAERAIFGGKKRFRENWSTILPDSAAILGMAGDLRELALSTEYDSRNDKSNPQKGMLGALDWRRSLTSGSSNFDYQMISGELKMYLPIAQNQNILIRARGGYSDDDLPLFRRFFLGGVGSLRGYEYKEYEGNRSMLFSSDYVWRFYHTDFGAGIFFDAGKAAVGGKVFEKAELKSDIGISFLIEDAFRLDLAQRLDDLNKAPVISARLQMTL